MHELIPLTRDQCEAPCSGDENQYCGGILSSIINAFVAGCEESWTRFSDRCFQLDMVQGLPQALEDRCGNSAAHLWAPRNLEDLEFAKITVSKAFADATSVLSISVGVVTVRNSTGYIAADYSYIPGVDFITHLPDGEPILSDGDYLSGSQCAVYSFLEDQMKTESPCIPSIGLCEKPLGK